MSQAAVFAHWLARWQLAADGASIHTHSSDLLPVRLADGTAAMLKLPREDEERRGGILMCWWNGQGAARVYRYDEDDGALLMERAQGQTSLAAMAIGGQDMQATAILCAAAARLHEARSTAPPEELLPLRTWFAALAPSAATHAGVLAHASRVADRLLDDPRDDIPLHGDLHHDNVLDFGPERGWLAIDPKRVRGERGYDFANLLCNPDAGHPDAGLVLAPGRLQQQASLIADLAGLELRRLLEWTLAYAGLSAAWILDDGDDASLDLQVATLVLAELNR